MYQIKKILVLSVILSLSFCAAQNTDEPDFTSGPSFKLSTGGDLSLSEYDEFSPQLVQHDDGFLTLVFVSNRPCTTMFPCSEGYYSIFVSRSVAAYSGGVLPAFTTPKTIEGTNGDALYAALEPFIVGAIKNGVDINLFYSDISGVNKCTIISLDSVPAASGGYCSPLSLSGHELLGVNMLANGTNDEIYIKGDVQGEAKLFVSDGSIPMPLAMMDASSITNIAPLSAAASGSTTAFFYSDGGTISMGGNNL